MNIDIEVNGKTIRTQRGITILEALKNNGIYIPTLCSIEGYRSSGSCRLCVVEIEGRRDLVPACSFQAEEWMKIRTHSLRVIQARKTILELLLASHPSDCLYCGESGDCGLHKLVDEMNLVERGFSLKRDRLRLDNTSQALVFDPSKCILCGRCVTICEKEQQVAAIDFMNRGHATRIGTSLDKGLNYSTCINCGQCLLVCPTGALQEASSMDMVIQSLSDRDLMHIAVIDPVVSATMSEISGAKQGKDAMLQITGALKKIGFDHVYEGLWASVLENHYLIKYLNKEAEPRTKPLIVGSCPAIRQFIEQQKPEMRRNLSPLAPGRYLLSRWIREMTGALSGKAPTEVRILYVSPCTAFKRESKQPVFQEGNYKIDWVFSAKELFRLIRLFGIRFDDTVNEVPDIINLNLPPSGALAAVGGGGLEMFIEQMIAGNESKDQSGFISAKFRGLKKQKETRLEMGTASFGVQFVSDTHAFAKSLEKEGEALFESDLVEAMACPYGCISGGGLVPGSVDKNLRARMKIMYEMADSRMKVPLALNPGMADLPSWPIEELLIFDGDDSGFNDQQ